MDGSDFERCLNADAVRTGRFVFILKKKVEKSFIKSKEVAMKNIP